MKAQKFTLNQTEATLFGNLAKITTLSSGYGPPAPQREQAAVETQGSQVVVDAVGLAAGSLDSKSRQPWRPGEATAPFEEEDEISERLPILNA